jgi:dihydrofolate reductase
MIWAENQVGVIGDHNKIPWHIPNDLKRFKSLTTGKDIVMGFKTWDSLPVKPLPERTNYVLTHKTSSQLGAGAIKIDSIQAIIDLSATKDVFVIGGKTLYQALIKYADFLYVTIVDNKHQGDTVMNLNLSGFVEIKREEFDGYSFINYQSK